MTDGFIALGLEGEVWTVEGLAMEVEGLAMGLKISSFSTVRQTYLDFRQSLCLYWKKAQGSLELCSG
jgi:hypothetical protein